jgi:hypothetical protein
MGATPQRCFAIALLTLFLCLGVPADAIAQEATPTPATGAQAGPAEVLMHDEPALMDHLGRVPLMRVTFAPGAALPATFVEPRREDSHPYFPERLILFVEKGTFAFDVASASFSAEAGERVDVAEGAAVAIRNSGAIEGSLLVLRGRQDYREFFPMDDFELNEFAPDGVAFDQLFLHIDLRSRLLDVRLSLHRITLQPGEAFQAFDFGGTTPTRSILIRIDSGAIVEADAPAEAEVTPEAEELNVYAGGFLIESGLRAVGVEPAVLLVARIAEASGVP